MKKTTLKILVLSDFCYHKRNANNIRDYLFSFNAHSQHKFFYLLSFRQDNCKILRHILNLNNFDAIVLFWDYPWFECTSPRSPAYIPEAALAKIASSSALKILFLQDEYRCVRQVNEVMRRLGVQVMFTNVRPEHHDLFYPAASIPSLESIYHVFTGYVPAYLEKEGFAFHGPKSVEIGYRSRRIPFYLGSLGQEKTVIADQFQVIAKKYGFSADISVEEKDRIYGDKWIDFLKSCRYVIGTESGASVVDFTGTIQKQCETYLKENPQASFAEVREKFLTEVDGRVTLPVISPRVFESAAVGNTLVLHEGKYDDVLQPDFHYIPVKKDYSNIEEVVEKMRDRVLCERLAVNLHNDVVRSRRYNYEQFVHRFDQALETHRPARTGRGMVTRIGFYLKKYLYNDGIIPKGNGFMELPSLVPSWLKRFGNRAGSLGELFSRSPRLGLLLVQNVLGDLPAWRTSVPAVLRELNWLSILIRHKHGLKARGLPAGSTLAGPLEQPGHRWVLVSFLGAGDHPAQEKKHQGWDDFFQALAEGRVASLIWIKCFVPLDQLKMDLWSNLSTVVETPELTIHSLDNLMKFLQQDSREGSTILSGLLNAA